MRLENLSEFCRHHAKKFGKSVAFRCVMPNGMNGSLSYEDVDHDSDLIAAHLQNTLELKPGARVALQVPNSLVHPLVAFAVWKAGGVLVNVNPLYTPSEMKHQFNDAGVDVLFACDIFADKVAEVLPHTPIRHVVLCRIDEFFPISVRWIIRLVQKFWTRNLPAVTFAHHRFKSLLKKSSVLTRHPLHRESLAVLQYTGGTTGVSKGAMLTHGNLLANIEQTLEFCGPSIREREECILTALPLYHIFAFTVNFLVFYASGGRNILIPNPRPLANLKRAFENEAITWISGVNTLFNGLTNEVWFQDSPPKHLRCSVAGGMALQGSVAERWKTLTGTPVVEGYGLTESSPVLCFNPLVGEAKPGSIGVPFPRTQVKCVNDNGQELPAGEAGEIIARGPQVMAGYWNKPDETQKVLKDNWLYTGDIGVQDPDGFFRIVDRKKDMILVSGFNVYPNEVEDVLAKHPAVKEVAVVGAKDSTSGELVVAYVSRKDPALKDSELREFAKKYLAAYKVPKVVRFLEDLPKSNVGKILRKELRTRADNKQDSGS